MLTAVTEPYKNPPDSQKAVRGILLSGKHPGYRLSIGYGSSIPCL